jgi:hypothetical protein
MESPRVKRMTTNIFPGGRFQSSQKWGDPSNRQRGEIPPQFNGDSIHFTLNPVESKEESMASERHRSDLNSPSPRELESRIHQNRNPPPKSNEPIHTNKTTPPKQTNNDEQTYHAW